MARSDGGPAFPTILKVGEIAKSEDGMSLRDYHAAHSGIKMSDLHHQLTDSGEVRIQRLVDAHLAYADAMVKASRG